jgi:hypothetical protein
MVSDRWLVRVGSSEALEHLMTLPLMVKQRWERRRGQKYLHGYNFQAMIPITADAIPTGLVLLPGLK